MVRKSVGRKMAAAALFTAALSGCKNGFEIPIWNPFASKPSNPALTQDSDGGHWQNEEIQPRESAFTKSFKKLGDTVSKPFKKKEATVAAPEDEAISVTSKSAPLGPDLYVSLARMEAKAGRFDAAVGQYQKALDADPNHLEALLGMARLYDRQEEQGRALEYYRRAAKAHPENSTAQNDLGLSYAKNDRFDESIAALQRAVTIDPDHKLYRNNLAIVLVEAGRTAEALRTLTPVHGEAVANYNVGFLLQRGGHKDSALRHFEKSLELDPTLSQARHFVALLRKETGATAAAATQTDRRQSAPAREPGTITDANRAVNSASTSRQSEMVQADAVPLDTVPLNTAPLDSVPSNTAPIDAPIATPYVPQSDIAPKTRPISRSTVVQPEVPPAPKPTNTRMSPMNPHQPPRVEMPARPLDNAAPAGDDSDELIGPKLMQNRPVTGDRYEVVGSTRSPAPPQTPLPRSSQVGVAAPVAARRAPPLPEQVSSLEDEAPAETSTPKARTAAGAARYPASRY
jgi:tetratricopeptide (TPR) repeat protein